jgi:hypothetical protein
MRRMVTSQRTQIVRHVAELSQHSRIAEITRGRIARAAECDRACMTQYFPKTLRTPNRDCRVWTNVNVHAFLFSSTKPLGYLSIGYAAAELGDRQSFMKAARSHARAAFFMAMDAALPRVCWKAFSNPVKEIE